MALNRTPSVSKSLRRRRILAVLAGGLVLGVGGTMTLASWTDSEWVWGGADGGPGIGTSEFVVLQNTLSPANGDVATGWVEEPDNPGGELVFSPLTVGDDILALTPGETFYAPVALKTSDTSIAGTVDLLGAVAAAGVTVDDAGDLLWDNLGARVALEILPAADTAPTCDQAYFAAAGVDVIVGAGGAAPLDTAGLADQPISGGGDDVHYYCFEISLPDNAVTQTLQGRTVAPAWQFFSTSV
ncbi:SipW-dependent-type signal peptide-containing protein [Microbacterium sp. HD4P20]|uniref:SipW-dependent-type signal peptide-containing protein n=1 Tax=Microbacterium sp. HD4P20 TaxID=2864874 RepID=UPI0020A44C25|nr:SipW-dependent-type signal peptide-containing protein [Microbacterium sp. HD4P20]MCP2638135.1 SipW-dependent-type signal peptide-containing protein [Microbacterium sp. HD4P20]